MSSAISGRAHFPTGISKRSFCVLLSSTHCSTHKQPRIRPFRPLPEHVYVRSAGWPYMGTVILRRITYEAMLFPGQYILVKMFTRSHPSTQQLLQQNKRRRFSLFLRKGKKAQMPHFLLSALGYFFAGQKIWSRGKKNIRKSFGAF